MQKLTVWKIYVFANLYHSKYFTCFRLAVKKMFLIQVEISQKYDLSVFGKFVLSVFYHLPLSIKGYNKLLTSDTFEISLKNTILLLARI